MWWRAGHATMRPPKQEEQVADYVVSKNGRVVEFDDPEKFVSTIETMLQLGERFLVAVAKSAARVLERVNELFRRFGLEIHVSADSDPTAMDYVANALLGGLAGGGLGAAGGAGAWLAGRALGFAVPGIGQFLLVGSVIGAIIGAATGLVVTRWGLKIRISPLDPSKVDIEMVPLSS